MPQAKKRKYRAPVKKSNTPLLLIGGAGALLVVGLLLLLNMNLNKNPVSPTVSAGKIWGNANAAVSIEVFSDFQ